MSDAEQFPRQSYEDIKANGPDESAYKSMEVVASAEGPEAQGRRNEMAKWSDATGKLAEANLAQHLFSERNVDAQQFTPEEVKKRLYGVNEMLGSKGVEIFDRSSRTSKVHKAEENGAVSVTIEGDHKATYRSPAHISEPVPSDSRPGERPLRIAS